MNEEKIKEVFSDEAYVKSLLAMDTPEEVQESLAAKDIDFTVDEIKQLGQLLVKKANGELSDDELNEVSGGFLATALITVCVTLHAAILAGLAYTVCSSMRGHW